VHALAAAIKILVTVSPGHSCEKLTVSDWISLKKDRAPAEVPAFIAKLLIEVENEHLASLN
jgi:hypothetical protein